jgi:hypothetical protein
VVWLCLTSLRLQACCWRDDLWLLPEDDAVKEWSAFWVYFLSAEFELEFDDE